jgi:hypothetical protein
MPEVVKARNYRVRITRHGVQEGHLFLREKWGNNTAMAVKGFIANVLADETYNLSNLKITISDAGDGE